MAQELIPGLSPGDVITSFAGIRSENNKAENSDFYIAPSEKAPGVIHAVIGSPGLTAAPAIADYVRNMLEDIGCRLEEKPDFRKNRISWPRFSDAGVEELEALTAENPKYGRILCRCETVTEAEIEQAVLRGADTTDAVKHVTRAGMGRCQGGFCGPSVLNALCKHLNTSPENVTKKGKGSCILSRKMNDRDMNVS
jgi:glycerol-3-phosphate dehydrogenase